MSIYLLMAISQRTERTATAQRPAMGSQLVAAMGPQSQMRPMISPSQQSAINHSSQQVVVTRASSATPDKTTFFKLLNSAHQKSAHPIHTTHASSALFDDDPGIMSEMETSATGFRRGNKARASLPIVRTPSKTQDRSLGLVFLQYRTETKRALLPNEITSIDTVKALFVRSFPRQLSMEYLDCPVIRIYIHDPSKDMFYELEDLRDVRDRCVLRIYEHGVNGPQPVGGHSNLPIPWSDSEQFGYFSEPEFDSESRHVHRPKRPTGGQTPSTGGQSQYYGTIILPPQYNKAQTISTRNYMPANAANQQPSPHPPERAKPYPGYSQTLPRGAHIMSLYGNLVDNNANTTNQTISQTQQQRSVSPDLIQKRPKEPIGISANTCAPPKPQRSFISHSRSPNIAPPRSVTSPTLVPPVYHQNRPLPDRPYSAAGHYPSPERGRPYQQDFSGYLSSPECRVPQDTQMRSSYSGYPSLPFEDPYGIYGMRSGAVTPVIDEEARHRMHAMERQLASLTNVVTQALTPAQSAAQQQNQKYEKPGKPLPPPKPASLIGYRGEPAIGLTIDMFTQLRQIRKKTKDLRGEMRALRRMALQQTATAKETLRDTCAKIKTTLGFLSASNDCQLRLERLKISHERDSYEQDVYRLDKDLQELESQVEELRSDVINRRCRVNMSHVESMALVLSRASKTVADLKTRYPMLSQTLKTVMTQEMECCVKEEKFLKEEPDRLETALKRCKKLTGTLVTLKRLASVQEQRSTSNQNSSSPSQLLQSVSADTTERDIASRAKRMQSWRRSSNFRDNVNHKIDLWRGFASMPEHTASSQKQSYDIDLEPHTILHVTPGPTPLINDLGKTNVLDTLLDELQTFSKPASTQSSTTAPLSAPLGLQSTARRLVQAINSVDSPSAKKGPQVSTIPTPPPRSSSRINPIVLSSFTVRPPSYASIRSNSEPPPVSLASRPRSTPPEGIFPEGDDPLVPPSSSTSSLSSVGSQGSVVEKRFAQSRQELLEQRHQELLRKQQQLQEQYTRLQQLSRGQIPRGILNELKKTGSEGNIVSKASMNLNAVHGSLKDLVVNKPNGAIDSQQQKIFETDIL